MSRYGEEISFDFNLLKVEDYEDLQPFTCGNEKLDSHIHNDVIKNKEIIDEDGLYFIFREHNSKKIIAIVSLATSGVIFEQTNYMHVLPAIKIDVLAVDLEYQKMHYNIESENSTNPGDHYYFSDEIMGEIINHCSELSETKALARYIILYADVKAYRYYQRNGFSDFEEFMIKENNQEINDNIPMYMKLI